MIVELVNKRFEEATDLGKIDLLFADPPDNLGLDYDGYKDALPEKGYRESLAGWLVKCCRITSGPVFFTFNERWTGCVERAIEDHGLRLVRRIQWFYTFGQCTQKNYAPCLRPIYWLNNPLVFPEKIKIPSARQAVYGDKRARAGGKMPPNVWNFEPPENLWRYSRVCGTFKEKRAWHVCQIPEALLERVILGHSQPGDRICDPFVGSGTTVYVADRLGRDVIGLDQSQHYLDEIEKELENRRSGGNVNGAA